MKQRLTLGLTTAIVATGLWGGPAQAQAPCNAAAEQPVIVTVQNQRLIESIGAYGCISPVTAPWVVTCIEVPPSPGVFIECVTNSTPMGWGTRADAYVPCVPGTYRTYAHGSWGPGFNPDEVHSPWVTFLPSQCALLD